MLEVYLFGSCVRTAAVLITMEQFDEVYFAPRANRVLK